MYPYPGSGALQVQGDSEMDKLFRPKLGEKEGGDQVEELSHMPGLRSTSTAVGHTKYSCPYHIPGTWYRCICYNKVCSKQYILVD